MRRLFRQVGNGLRALSRSGYAPAMDGIPRFAVTHVGEHRLDLGL
jgi:hypothetical protein